jgi:hypothetical protein
MKSQEISVLASSILLVLLIPSALMSK